MRDSTTLVSDLIPNGDNNVAITLEFQVRERGCPTITGLYDLEPGVRRNQRRFLQEDECACDKKAKDGVPSQLDVENAFKEEVGDIIPNVCPPTDPPTPNPSRGPTMTPSQFPR